LEAKTEVEVEVKAKVEFYKLLCLLFKRWNWFLMWNGLERSWIFEITLELLQNAGRTVFERVLNKLV
jgi:hypothetical protein